MLRKLLLVVSVLLPVGLWAGVESVQGQAAAVAASVIGIPGGGADCGLECEVCGTKKWEGKNHDDGGPYDMDCGTNLESGGGCTEDSCPGVDENGPNVANGDWIPADVIARLVESAPVAELAATVEAYQDRLLYAPERHAVVVKGIPCNADWLASMVILSPEKAGALAPLKVSLLRNFLADREAVILALAR